MPTGDFDMVPSAVRMAWDMQMYGQKPSFGGDCAFSVLPVSDCGVSSCLVCSGRRGADATAAAARVSFTYNADLAVLHAKITRIRKQRDDLRRQVQASPLCADRCLSLKEENDGLRASLASLKASLESANELAEQFREVAEADESMDLRRKLTTEEHKVELQRELIAELRTSNDDLEGQLQRSERRREQLVTAYDELAAEMQKMRDGVALRSARHPHDGDRMQHAIGAVIAGWRPVV